MSNASQIPFSPTGATVVVPSDTVAPTGVATTSTTGVGQYRVVNSGAVMVHLGYGSSASIATANAVAAIAGTPSKSVPLVPGAVEVLRFSNNAFFSALSASPVSVYITPGQGI
jgi:hypothetical protein